MSSVNKVILIGNLGKDPELRMTQNGKPVASFSLAVSEKWTDAQGQKQERTEWVNLTAWDKKAELIGQYVKKGHKLYVEGKLQTRQWDDQQGVKHYKTEVIVEQVVFLTPSSQGSAPQEPQQEQQPYSQPTQQAGMHYEPVQQQQQYQQPRQPAQQQQQRPAQQQRPQQHPQQQGGYQQRTTQQRPQQPQPQWSKPGNFNTAAPTQGGDFGSDDDVPF